MIESLFCLRLLTSAFLFDDVNVVLLQASGQWVEVVVVTHVFHWELHLDDLMVSYQVLVDWATLFSELVLIQASLVSYLVSDELDVVAGSHRLVDDLVLLKSLLNFGVDKLRHFRVISEDIQWQVGALGDGHELLLLLVVGLLSLLGVFLVLNEGVGSIEDGTAFKCGQRLDHLSESLVLRNVLEAEATVLLVEEVTKVEGMGDRGVVLKLMEEEGILVFVQQVNLKVLVLMVFHIVQSVLHHREQLNEDLGALAHQEHWEVVGVLPVVLGNVLHDEGEGLLVLAVGHRLLAISWHVDTIDLIQDAFDRFCGVQVRDRDDSDASLLQELNMGPWYVGDLLFRGVPYCINWFASSGLMLGTLSEISSQIKIVSLPLENVRFHWLCQYSVNWPSFIG